jgi:hypothetical protein
VLEIECSGGFVSGPRAATIVASRRSDGGRGRIADLSCAALRYAQELEGLSAPRLAHRLYTYGRRPVTPALQRRLPDSARVLEFVGITAPVTRHTLAAGWCEDPVQATEARHWSTWRPRTRRPAEAHAQRYKLYISPSIDHLAETVAMVAAVLPGARGVKAFKVGADLPGICRPDKLVVYFDSLDALQEAAGMLQARLAGAAPHGVPFTAAITHDGLLSWGSDPPAAASHAHGRPGSWRTWVTARLAEYLVAARIDGAAEIEPWQFALERLRLSGVDTDTWIPTARMWAHALESA